MKLKQRGTMDKVIRIWHISDTHTWNHLLTIPEDIDIVVHSGDCSNPKDPFMNEPEVHEFLDWYSSLPIKTKIFVAGNHDTSIEKGLIKPDYISSKGITYLENSYALVMGLKIFGSPLTPTFGIGWAFNKSRPKLDRVWRDLIEPDTDIVVTHGPPKGILDLSYDRDGNLERCGDKSLLNRILEVQPKLSLFGHLHNVEDIINQGILKLSNLDTLFSNGSVVTDGKFGRLSSNGNILEIKN